MYKLDLGNIENALQIENAFIVITRDYKNVRTLALVGASLLPITYTSHMLQKLLTKSNDLINGLQEEDETLDIGYAADENTLDRFLSEGYLLITKFEDKFSLVAKFVDEDNEVLFHKRFYAKSVQKLLNDTLKWTDSFYLDFLGEL